MINGSEPYAADGALEDCITQPLTRAKPAQGTNTIAIEVEPGSGAAYVDAGLIER
jgi:hypothetical protein